MDTLAVVAEVEALIKAKHAKDWLWFEHFKSSILTPARDLLNAVGKSNEAPSKTTIIGAVERLFRQYPEATWSVPSLEQQLQKEGYTFASKNPRISLNTALARLIAKEHIEVCEQGVGRRPSLYMAKRPGNAKSLLGRYAAIGPMSENGKVEVVKDEAEESVT